MQKNKSLPLNRADEYFGNNAKETQPNQRFSNSVQLESGLDNQNQENMGRYFDNYNFPTSYIRTLIK